MRSLLTILSVVSAWEGKSHPVPEYKLCPDCVGFDVATLDLVNITQGKIGENWANLTYNACMTANDEETCDFFVNLAMKNVLQTMTQMKPNDWCANITMCKPIKIYKTQAPRFTKITPGHDPGKAYCFSCTEMVQDVIDIAKGDAKQFGKIWTAITQQACSVGLISFEQKKCLKDLQKYEGGILDFMKRQDAWVSCVALEYCDADYDQM